MFEFPNSNLLLLLFVRILFCSSLVLRCSINFFRTDRSEYYYYLITWRSSCSASGCADVGAKCAAPEPGRGIPEEGNLDKVQCIYSMSWYTDSFVSSINFDRKFLQWLKTSIVSPCLCLCLLIRFLYLWVFARKRQMSRASSFEFRVNKAFLGHPLQVRSSASWTLRIKSKWVRKHEVQFFLKHFSKNIEKEGSFTHTRNNAPY